MIAGIRGVAGYLMATVGGAAAIRGVAMSGQSGPLGPSNTGVEQAAQLLPLLLWVGGGIFFLIKGAQQIILAYEAWNSRTDARIRKIVSEEMIPLRTRLKLLHSRIDLMLERTGGVPPEPEDATPPVDG